MKDEQKKFLNLLKEKDDHYQKLIKLNEKELSDLRE